jgi:hypothetical protein
MIRDFLAAGLVDHMHTVVVPILLGRGVRLWDGLEELEKDYEIEATSSPSGVRVPAADWPGRLRGYWPSRWTTSARRLDQWWDRRRLIRLGGALLVEAKEPTPAPQATIDVEMADGREKSQLRPLPVDLGRVTVGGEPGGVQMTGPGQLRTIRGPARTPGPPRLTLAGCARIPDEQRRGRQW